MIAISPPDPSPAPTEAEAAAIAATLTADQRAALLWLPEDGSQGGGSGHGQHLLHYPALESLAPALVTRDLSRTRWGEIWWRLTEAGARVRAMLEGGR